MSLERWNIGRYTMPHLHVDAIRRVADALELDTPRGRFRLSCDSAGASDDELAPVLEALRDPRDGIWGALRQGQSGLGGLAPMLRELDHLGLIRECGAGGAQQAQQEMAEALRHWSAELGGELAKGAPQALPALRRLAGRLGAAPVEARATTLAEPNFALLTILLQARYLRADAPGLLALLIQGMLAAERRARLGAEAGAWPGIGPMPAWAEEDWSCGLVDPATLRAYLAATGALLRDAFGPRAARRARATRAAREPVSGINFMLDLEHEVAGTLARLGPSSAFAACADPALALDVVRAAFLQEYFVTCRFTECVAPLLSRRFGAPLRASVHRYFGEEMGHEQFERENCLRLGLTGQQIDAAAPLPLHLAFIDIITGLARESPIAYFCATMFTEGMIGAEHSLVSLARQAIPDDPALLRAISGHMALNDDADHRGVGRDWMSQVPLVAPGTQAELSELLAYLAELNWRMWDQLVQSCAPVAP